MVNGQSKRLQYCDLLAFNIRRKLWKEIASMIFASRPQSMEDCANITIIVFFLEKWKDKYDLSNVRRTICGTLNKVYMKDP